MRPALIGRDAVVRNIEQLLADGVSVLLVGPSGIGKTALIDAINMGAESAVMDPFERTSRQRAAALRRHLDRGGTIIGTAQTLDRRRLGAVGRILWRFRIVRVPPLRHADICEVIRRALPAAVRSAGNAESWLRQVARRASGLPGRGCALAAAGDSYWRRHRALPSPAWTIVEALTTGHTARQ